MNRTRLIASVLLTICLGVSTAAGTVPRTQAATTPNPVALLRQSIATMKASVHSSRSSSVIAGNVSGVPRSPTGRCALTGNRITATWSWGKGGEKGLVWSLSPNWAAVFERASGRAWFPAALGGYGFDVWSDLSVLECSLLWIRRLDLQPPTGLTLVGATTVDGEPAWQMHGSVAGVPADLFVGQRTPFLRRVTTWVTTSGRRVLDRTDYSGFNDPITIRLPSVTLSAAREEHTAVRLSDGRVLVVGGRGPDFSVRTGWVELYNPATGTWTREGGPASAPVFPSTAVAIRGGRAVVDASFWPVLGTFGSHMIFTAATHTWRSMPAPHVTRLRPLWVTLKDGRLLETGGTSTATGWAGGSTELYNPTTGSWSQTGSAGPAPAWAVHSVVMKDGRVLVVDGNNTRIFSPVRGTWSRVAGAPKGMDALELNLWPLPSGAVLAVGVAEPSGNTCYPPCGPPVPLLAAIFDPARNTWSEPRRSPLTYPNGFDGSASALLRTGKLLVAGGLEPWLGSYRGRSSVWLFDPASGTWAKTGSMRVGRTLYTLSLLNDGKVLAAGGIGAWSPPEVLSSAELYNPATGRWSLTGSMK